MQNYPTIMMHQLQKFEQETLDIYNQGTAKELQEIVARIVADIQGYSHGMNNIKCDINLKKIEKLVHSSISIGEHPINPKGNGLSYHLLNPEVAKKGSAVLRWAMGENPIIFSVVRKYYYTSPIYRMIPDIIRLLDGDMVELEKEQDDTTIDYIRIDDFSCKMLLMVTEELYSNSDDNTPMDGYRKIMKEVIDEIEGSEKYC